MGDSQTGPEHAVCLPTVFSVHTSPFHLHEIMISQWRDHKLLFSRIPIRHATVNKSLNHCRLGLGQRTIQKPLLQMAHQDEYHYDDIIPPRSFLSSVIFIIFYG